MAAEKAKETKKAASSQHAPELPGVKAKAS